MRLTVKPLKQKDAGRGLAAIDRAAMAELDLENGDYIVIEGDARAVARVWPGYPEDEGRGVIRIDGRLRQEADAGIDDNVDVEKADVKPAKRVQVALPQNLRVRGDVAPMIRNNLSGQAITEGQTVPVSFGLGPLSSMCGQQIPLKVASTDPSGTVVVTDSTDVEVTDEPAEQIQGTGRGGAEAPDVTYEDIGGLDNELEQVREMIELPMRHPELFQQLGIEPPKGVLLHGPPAICSAGCSDTCTSVESVTTTVPLGSVLAIFSGIFWPDIEESGPSPKETGTVWPCVTACPLRFCRIIGATFPRTRRFCGSATVMVFAG